MAIIDIRLWPLHSIYDWFNSWAKSLNNTVFGFTPWSARRAPVHTHSTAHTQTFQWIAIKIQLSRNRMRLLMGPGWGGQCRALSNRAKCANKWIVCYNVTYTCNRIHLPYHTHTHTPLKAAFSHSRARSVSVYLDSILFAFAFYVCWWVGVSFGLYAHCSAILCKKITIQELTMSIHENLSLATNCDRYRKQITTPAVYYWRMEVKPATLWQLNPSDELHLLYTRICTCESGRLQFVPFIVWSLVCWKL